MKRIDETDVLLIDEVSMLSADLLETIDGVVREIRCGGKYSNDPMGGMQIVAVGDFHQLPKDIHAFFIQWTIMTPIYNASLRLC